VTSPKGSEKILKEYGRCYFVKSAENVFNCMNERNIITLNAMLIQTSYANGGDLTSARKMFDGMPQRCFSDALYLFRKMLIKDKGETG
jgi:hypothetical protein